MRDNPYVGPRPFEIGDKDLFFGREQESQGLLSLVLSQRVVLFFSPSGAGKSSLINTCLVPELISEGFVVYPVGRIKGSEQANQRNIANIFTYNLLNSISRNQSLEIPGYLSLAGFLEDDILEKGDEDAETKRVLIIDQFEELFTSHLDRWQERKAFFDQLRQSLDSDPLLWLILVMREDHIANLEPYTSLLPGRLQTRFYMPRMNAATALEAIKRPAEKAGRVFAPGVAEELVDNLRQIHTSTAEEKHLGEFVEPVQLQVACRQLWTNLASRSTDIISGADVKELGDIDAALAQFYDGVVQDVVRLVGIPEWTLRTWFENELITEIGTRALVYEGAEQTAGIHNSAVRELTNRYLIRAETRPGGTWYELVHDRFVLPIQRSNREWLLLQNPVLQDAYAWDRSGRDESLLYQGGRLELALSSIDQQKIDPLGAAFLKTSKNVQDQRELAQRVATARRDRILLVIFGILFIGAAILASLFWQQRQIAMENAALAQTAQLESSQGRATIAAHVTVQAEQLIALQDSLDQQLALLEEQKVLLSEVAESNVGTTLQPTPTLPAGSPETTPVLPGSPTATREIVGAGVRPTLTPTINANAIETQIAQVNATQTAIAVPQATQIGIAVPEASLQALFPAVSVAIREQPSVDSQIREFITGAPTLPVVATSDTWIQVEFPDGSTGWVVGFLLTFEGDRDHLPQGLHYRLISNRNRADLPFVYGQVSTTDEISLLRDPSNLESIITSLPGGTEVVVLLNVDGSTTYGSGRWYLVDVVQNRALWTGYLPVESVVERE